MGGFDPIATLDPGGLIYQSSDPNTLQWQSMMDIGGIGAKPIYANQQAAAQQQTLTNAALQDQQKRFNTIISAMSPFTQAGESALSQQQGLLGLRGAPTQQSMIQGIMNLPQYQSAINKGENAILQNASASGNLRGGNTQAMLAQYRPQVLSSLINQQLANFGGLSSLGQASAAGQGAYGQTTAGNISNILQSGAANQAGAALAQGAQQANTVSTLTPMIASFF